MSTPEITSPFSIGVAGLGGYAGVIVDRLVDESRSPSGLARLATVCDLDPVAHPDRLARVQSVGGRLADSFDAILADRDVRAVWLPLPIHLHRPFTERALAAGKHVITEKPAAGTVDEIDAMIAARNRAGLECLVAFQDVYQPAVQTLKRRLLSGELGRPQYATVLGCWPRGQSYYSRNRWAGRLKVGDSWVLDSPAANAMAHFIHLALYALGPSLNANAEAADIDAELYRAYDIENYDTCSMRVALNVGVDLTIAMTHACAETIEPEVQVVTDRYRIRIPLNCGVSYERLADGGKTFDAFVEESKFPVTNAIVRRLGHGDVEAPVGTLEMARAHTALINAASEATPVGRVPRSACTTHGRDTLAINGIEQALRRCVEERRTLHELGNLPWTRPAGRLEIDVPYRTFAGPFASAAAEPSLSLPTALSARQTARAFG